jgi:hypothetical protein
MQPFKLVVEAVSDADLGPVLSDLAARGYTSPTVIPTSGAAASLAGVPPRTKSEANDDLPTEWTLIEERSGQTYRWPEVEEHYDRYRIFTARTAREGSVHISLGEAPRAEAWGRERKYIIAFLSAGTPQTPLVEFLETDDYEGSRELLAVIRGSDGGRRMYGPTDTLPEPYALHFDTQIYRDRIDYARAWNKIAVVAHEDDHTTILNHALLQARRRGDL